MFKETFEHIRFKIRHYYNKIFYILKEKINSKKTNQIGVLYKTIKGFFAKKKSKVANSFVKSCEYVRNKVHYGEVNWANSVQNIRQTYQDLKEGTTAMANRFKTPGNCNICFFYLRKKTKYFTIYFINFGSLIPKIF